MRVGILTATQADDDVPLKHVSKSGAQSLIRRLLCEPVKSRKNVIREVKLKAAATVETFTSQGVPVRYLKPCLAIKKVPSLYLTVRSMPAPRGLLLQYPVKDESNYRKANRRRIWGREEDK